MDNDNLTTIYLLFFTFTVIPANAKQALGGGAEPARAFLSCYSQLTLFVARDNALSGSSPSTGEAGWGWQRLCYKKARKTA